MLGLLLCPAVAIAEDAIEIKPGLWKIKQSSRSGFSPTPMEDVDEECFTKNKFSAEDMIDADSTCKLVSSSLSDGVLKWKMSCDQPMPGTVGEGELSGGGTEIKGMLRMKVAMEGKIQTIETKWDGERIGDCPE